MLLGGGSECEEIRYLKWVLNKEVIERESRELGGSQQTDPQAKPLSYQPLQPVSCRLLTHILHTLIPCTQQLDHTSGLSFIFFPGTVYPLVFMWLTYLPAFGIQLWCHPSRKPS